MSTRSSSVYPDTVLLVRSQLPTIWHDVLCRLQHWDTDPAHVSFPFLDGVRQLCPSPAALQPHPPAGLRHRCLQADVRLRQRWPPGRGEPTAMLPGWWHARKPLCGEFITGKKGEKRVFEWVRKRLWFAVRKSSDPHVAFTFSAVVVKNSNQTSLFFYILASFLTVTFSSISSSRRIDFSKWVISLLQGFSPPWWTIYLSVKVGKLHSYVIDCVINVLLGKSSTKSNKE